MALEEKIMTDLKAAMLAKDEKSLRSLRAIKAAIIIAKHHENIQRLMAGKENKFGAK